MLLQTIIDFLHLLATVAWIGGAVYMNLVLMPSLNAIEPPARGKLMAAASKRFTIIAWIPIIQKSINPKIQKSNASKEKTMPYDEPDATDPNMLVGVELPGSAESTRDMAYTFAEEFARMGFEKRKLMSVFKTPFYAGAHRAYLELGEAEIEKIVDECLGIWGRLKVNVEE